MGGKHTPNIGERQYVTAAYPPFPLAILALPCYEQCRGREPEAGHIFYAAWWTRKYDCQYCLAARLSATSLCQWGARACRGAVPRAPGGCGLSGKLCCRLLFLIACHP